MSALGQKRTNRPGLKCDFVRYCPLLSESGNQIVAATGWERQFAFADGEFDQSSLINKSLLSAAIARLKLSERSFPPCLEPDFPDTSRPWWNWSGAALS